MIPRERLLEQVIGVRAEELETWIASGWVHPDGAPDHWVFREIDVARVRLIAELRSDLEIDDRALPVVLSLLDQLYAVRRDFTALCGALANQPQPVRQAIAAAIRDRQPK